MSEHRPESLSALKLCLCAMPLLLVACASQPDADAMEASTDAQVSERAIVPGAATRGGEASIGQTDSLPAQRVIHFEFDDSNVGSDYQGLLVAHGRYLADHSDALVRLEGHADERGTREYNVGLGERRASSVRRLLLLQGARDGQIEVLSYGEESPVVTGSGERSWSQNRRVEFNYLSE